MPKNLIRKIRDFSYNDGRKKSNEILKKSVERHCRKSLMDTGCGDGTFSVELARCNNIGDVYGVEFVDENRQKAVKKGIKCEKFDLNYDWPYKNEAFDLILSNQVIEHLHNTRHYLEECFRCLRPNGQILVATENLSSLVNIGALCFGWMPFSCAEFESWVGVGNPLKYEATNSNGEYRKNVQEVYEESRVTGVAGHVRVLSIMGLKDCLERTKFKRVRVGTSGFFPFWGWLSDFLCKIDKRHGHFLIATGFKLLGE